MVAYQERDVMASREHEYVPTIRAKQFSLHPLPVPSLSVEALHVDLRLFPCAEKKRQHRREKTSPLHNAPPFSPDYNGPPTEVEGQQPAMWIPWPSVPTRNINMELHHPLRGSDLRV